MFCLQELRRQRNFLVHLEHTPKVRHCGAQTNVQTVNRHATVLEVRPPLTCVHQATTVHETLSSLNNFPALIAHTIPTMENTSKPNARIVPWGISVKKVLCSHMNAPLGHICLTVLMQQPI